MANSKQVLVVGDLFLDMQVNGIKSLPSWNEDCLVDNIELLPGGSSANTARQLCVFPNINVDIFSVIGNDQLSQILINLIKDEQCNFILKRQNSSMQTCIVLSGDNDRSFITNRNNLKFLNCQLLDSHFKSSKNKSYDHVHIGGFYNCFGLHSMDLIKLLVYNGYKHKISLDLQMSQLKLSKHKRAIFIKLCSILSVLFVNHIELLELIGQSKNSKMSKFEAMDELIKMTRNDKLVIVMKMGSKGSLLRKTSGKIIQVFNMDIELNIVDTTGAGDAFAAGFLGSFIGNKLSETQQWITHLLFGTSTAGLCIGREGACPNPLKYERIHTFYKKVKNVHMNKQSKL